MDGLTRLAFEARDGDRRALELFVRDSQADVWRLCAHLGGREHADDLTQETFMRAIGALPSFRGESSVRTWLLAIARRTCADAVRRKIRVRRLLQRVTPRDELEPEPTGGPELDLVMARLDPDRKAAFVMTQVIGLSYAEAAEACGCPVGTIRSRVARAREDLVSWLTEDARQARHAGESVG